MEKTFKQKNFNNFVWTPLGSRVNIYITFCLQVHFKVAAAWYCCHYLPPVSLIPLTCEYLREFSKKFETVKNGILWGWGLNWFMKKTRSKKSRDTVPLKLKYSEDDSAHPVNGQVDCGNVHLPQVLLRQIVIIVLVLVVTLILLLIELYFESPNCMSLHF